jgi:hypothetical protein
MNKKFGFYFQTQYHKVFCVEIGQKYVMLYLLLHIKLTLSVMVNGITQGQRKKHS